MYARGGRRTGYWTMPETWRFSVSRIWSILSTLIPMYVSARKVRSRLIPSNQEGMRGSLTFNGVQELAMKMETPIYHQHFALRFPAMNNAEVIGSPKLFHLVYKITSSILVLFTT